MLIAWSESVPISAADAIDAYLEIYQWQLDHIQEGLRQADAGEFATEEEVAAAFARWRQ